MKGKIMCAENSMNVERRFLQARGARLYDRMPVAENWRGLFAKNLVNTAEFRGIARL